MTSTQIRELGGGHKSFDCCQVDIAALSPHDAVTSLVALSREMGGSSVHLCNAYTLSLAARDASYRALLNKSSLNLPDGTPVTWVGRAAGHALTGPVRGPELMLAVMRNGVQTNTKHMLYGGSPETLALLEQKLKKTIDGLIIVSAISPPFVPDTDEFDESFVAAVEETQPEVIWVGLGTPKQDLFIERMSTRVTGVLVAVGAAFDFAAGVKPEAPRWMHGTGLEWLFRLASEPRRLWKRYLVGNIIFIGAAARGFKSYKFGRSA